MSKKLPPIWELDPHTKAKHEILRCYLEAWFPILATWNGRVVFLDGFAGPGVYAKGEPGSPIIALSSLMNHGSFSKMSCKFTFVFFEPGRKRFEALEQSIERLGDDAGGLPGNVTVNAVPMSFEAGANDMLSSLEANRSSLAPTLAFIDPFGFSGLPIEVLARLAKYPRCELFVNFMFDHVNRFVTHEPVAGHFEELFGTDRFLEAAELRGEDRKSFLHDLYKEQLHEVCGLKYVTSFEMITHGGHTGYFLFHGTNHLTGVRCMKDAMWRVDPGGGSRFSDRLAGQDILFTEDNVDTGPLRQNLLEHFAGRTVPVEAIEEHVLVSTPYRATHYKRQVLAVLEREGIISIPRSPRKKSGSYPEGTFIEFPAGG